MRFSQTACYWTTCLITAGVLINAVPALAFQEAEPAAHADDAHHHEVVVDHEHAHGGEFDAHGGHDEIPHAVEFEGGQVSYLVWVLRSIGAVGLFALAVSFAIFLGAVGVVLFCQRPAPIAAYLAWVPVPFLLFASGTVMGMISSFQVISGSHSAPSPAALGAAISTSLFSTLLGILTTIPTLVVLALGLFLRTAFAPSEKSKTL